ncbi:hypothetical protein Afil01_51970 [Actinorhabdospora filicis]|uniref:Uncharacterized protein n=1 Tax=Actinorhabdospora filicis TaxID=1785913 RepID=A0A9W6WD23_9ACTN|nr:hypothetical protein Afil01_51970 [Actinorhabdospora filicis]
MQWRPPTALPGHVGPPYLAAQPRSGGPGLAERGGWMGGSGRRISWLTAVPGYIALRNAAPALLGRAPSHRTLWGPWPRRPASPRPAAPGQEGQAKPPEQAWTRVPPKPRAPSRKARP